MLRNIDDMHLNEGFDTFHQHKLARILPDNGSVTASKISGYSTALQSVAPCQAKPLLQINAHMRFFFPLHVDCP